MTDPTRQAVLEFVTSMKHGAFLITTQRDGRPYTVQISAHVLPDFSVRIRTNIDSLKAKHVRANPSVGVLIVERSAAFQRNVLIQGDGEVSADEADIAAFYARLEQLGVTLPPHFRAISTIIKIAPRFVRAEGFAPQTPAPPYIERFAR